MLKKIEDALHARFLRGLAVSGRRPALHTGTRTFTYEEVHDLALQWAGSLLANPAGPPRAIGVLAAKGIEAYAGILAGLYTGATVVPLYPSFPAARTRSMLQDAGVSAVLADDAGLTALAEALGPDSAPPVLAPHSAAGDGGFSRITVHGRDALAEPRPVAPDDRAYILFTSGSTGRPKGVPISHGSTTHYFELMDARYDFDADDVFSQTFDVNFDCAMFDMFCAWGAGGSIHPVPLLAFRDLPEFVAERRMTVWFSTPSTVSLIRRTGGLGPGTLASLRWSLFAGEALRESDAVDWQAAAPASTLENIYGPTELTVTVTGHRWSPETSPGLCVNGLVPIGTVHEGHDHLLLDEDDRPTDHEGELVVTGPQMTTGYLDPEHDHGRFLRHDGRTWYRTGDRVRRLDNGELIYLGRLDSQVQIQGWRVELAEVEHAVRSCEDVQDAVAVPRTTDSGTELVIFYTGVETSPATLAGRLRGLLPQGMVPKHYRHVDAFPLNSNRKVDRKQLRAEASLPLGTPSVN
ncbi:AMP-binding protein [Streptomyces sp. NPDC052701]|uniref:AMP-binding protein n=1 Tax=Streptomyces sp. NPDC052701 TaxID=3155533 RepID=UPI00344AAF11